MENFVTLDLGNFQQLMEDSMKGKEKTLKEDCVRFKFRYYDCIFNQGDTRHIFTQYLDFVLRSEDKILNNYRDMHYIYKSIDAHPVELKTISMDIPTYMFALSGGIVHREFDFSLYIENQIALKKVKEKYKDA